MYIDALASDKNGENHELEDIVLMYYHILTTNIKTSVGIEEEN